MLALKTNIYKSKLIVTQHIASLELEHSESNTDFKDRHYLRDGIKNSCKLKDNSEL